MAGGGTYGHEASHDHAISSWACDCDFLCGDMACLLSVGLSFNLRTRDRAVEWGKQLMEHVHMHDCRCQPSGYSMFRICHAVCAVFHVCHAMCKLYQVVMQFLELMLLLLVLGSRRVICKRVLAAACTNSTL